MGVYDVPASDLIEEIAKDFGTRIEKPAWAEFVKTGTSREISPIRKDWWQMRMASILYRIYADGPMGAGSLRTYYGNRKRRGVKTEHFRKASGKIIRSCLQMLEKEGLIKKLKKGRGISSKGEAYLNSKAKVVKELLKEKAGKEEESRKIRLEKMIAEGKAAEKNVPKRAEGAERRPEEKGGKRPKKEGEKAEGNE